MPATSVIWPREIWEVHGLWPQTKMRGASGNSLGRIAWFGPGRFQRGLLGGVVAAEIDPRRGRPIPITDATSGVQRRKPPRWASSRSTRRSGCHGTALVPGVWRSSATRPPAASGLASPTCSGRTRPLDAADQISQDRCRRTSLDGPGGLPRRWRSRRDATGGRVACQAGLNSVPLVGCSW